MSLEKWDFDLIDRPTPHRIRYGPKRRPFVGWDTETCHGVVGLLCGAFPGGGVSQTWRPVGGVPLRTVLDRLHHPERYGCWWNLSFDVETAILKRLPEDGVRALLSADHYTWDPEGDLGGPVQLRYLPGKKFTIRVGGQWTHHYDAAQFYGSSLDRAAKRHLGAGKSGDIDRRQLGEDWSYWSDRRAEIIRYCQRDAELTRRLMAQWVGWADELGIHPQNPISPAYLAGRHARERGWPRYTMTHHETVGPAAWAAYYGGRFEARLKGWMELHSADLRSAYPSVMVDLPNPEGRWDRVHRETPDLMAASWGFVKAHVRIGETPWPPLMVRAHDGLCYSPEGFLPDKWLTLDEYRWCRDDPSTTVDLRKAFVGPDDGTRPLSWLADLYHERNQLKANGDPRQAVLKVAMNSVYGKTLQRNAKTRELRPFNETDERTHREPDVFFDGRPYVVKDAGWRAGPCFNPMLASHITARTRLKLLDVCRRFDVAMVATDGLLSAEPLPSSLFGDGLGSWEDRGIRPGVVIGNGLYERVGETVKRRGFGAPSPSWGWIQTLMRMPPDADNVEVRYRRPIHPGEAMHRTDWSLDDVGVFVEDVRTIRFNDDRKRRFPDVTAEDLMNRAVEGVPYQHLPGVV